MRILLLSIVFSSLYSVHCGYPSVNPSEGKIWPKPQNEVTQSTYMMIQPENFTFSVTGFTCDILTKAIARYMSIITPKKRYNMDFGEKTSEFVANLTTIDINLLSPCESLPSLHMDEQYEIKIDSPDKPSEATIIANSIWGMLRGLESFTHLLVREGDSYRVNSTQIMDYPRFSHRGFMIDTSRHFLPVPFIEEMIDLMSMNKMNVLHWHIVDSQSFPYVSAAYPDLSLKGSYAPDHIYTAEDVAHVVNYALERGVRVLPEFDTPGHVDSWGPGQPGLLTPCYTNDKPDGTFGPVDPSNEDNYSFLSNLLKEVTTRFPDHYIHLGGDEVPFSCWMSNPNITAFMAQENITTYAGLEEYYITRLLGIVSDLPTKNGYLVWQEVFDNGVKLANDTVVHIWKNEGNTVLLQEELQNVTGAGFQTLVSSCWYLNYISYGVDWPKYYACDPQDFNGTDAQKSLVMGGEACMWAEYVDRTNLISRSWPRGSVVAEKLWSAQNATLNSDAAKPRLEEHRCRLLSRGFNVEPLWPSYCDSDLDY